jgi:hypothetical protein
MIRNRGRNVDARLVLQALEARDLPSFLAPAIYDAASNASYPVIADVNADGRRDVLIPTAPVGIAVLLGIGDGSLGPPIFYPAASGSSALAVTDINSDGKLDVATADRPTKTVSVLLGRGDGTFLPNINTSAGANEPGRIATGDFNNDGRPDLAVTYVNKKSGVGILMGNGDGTFEPITIYDTGPTAFYAPLSSIDLNSDGFDDVIVSNSYSNTVSVYISLGDGTFAPRVDYAAGDAPHGQAIGDVNKDGWLDLVIGNGDVVTLSESSVSILLGNGDGSFAPPRTFVTGLAPQGPVLADVNRDRKLDIATVSPQSGLVSLHLGNGDGTFGAPTTYADIGNNQRGFAGGDLNNDRYPDLVITRFGSNKVTVLLNDGAWTAPLPSAQVEREETSDRRDETRIAVMARPPIVVDGAGAYDASVLASLPNKPQLPMSIIVLDDWPSARFLAFDFVDPIHVE